MKGLKKLGSLFLVAIFLLVGIANVKAYTTIDLDDTDNNRITLNFTGPDDAEFGEYISISTSGKATTSYIKDENAKVYLQYVEVLKDKYDVINTKYDAYVAAKGTAGETAAFTDYINAVPDPVDGAWKEIALSKTTTDVNYYNVKVDDTAPKYFVAWVKVEVAGKDPVYGYNVKCLADLLPKVCKPYNGKWYNKKGEPVTEAEYLKECEVCTTPNNSNDGKYHDANGQITDEAGYRKACNPNCEPKDGEYYDNDGNPITKSQFDKLCGNPKTGNQTFYMYGIATVGIAFVLYMFTRKIRKFSK